MIPRQVGSAVSSVDPSEQETEFYRRRNLPYVDVRYLSAGRTFDVHLSYCGKDLGSKTEVKKRGKVISVHYCLPPIDMEWWNR